MINQTIYDIIGIIEEIKKEIVLRTKLNTETERQTICKKISNQRKTEYVKHAFEHIDQTLEHNVKNMK